MTHALNDTQVDESIRFADGAMAAAGHFVDRAETRRDAERVLRGKLTAEEAIESAVLRIRR